MCEFASLCCFLLQILHGRGKPLPYGFYFTHSMVTTYFSSSISGW